MSALQSYGWPGNVRELENVIERAVILARGSELTLGDSLPRGGGATAGNQRFATLDDMQREHILRALELTGWRVSGDHGAAKILGINPTTLEARMQKLGIKRKQYRAESD